jgi:cell pole-organizing protein PopZ
VVKTPPVEPVASTAPAASDKSAAQIALETTATSGAAAQPTASAKAVAAPADAGSRTLEDVVADMVRPMLQKWIDENMPRIVERALKRDPLLGPKSDT